MAGDEDIAKKLQAQALEAASRGGGGTSSTSEQQQDVDEVLKSLGVAPTSEVLSSMSSMSSETGGDNSGGSPDKSLEANSASPRMISKPPPILSVVSVQATNIPPKETVTYTKGVQTATSGDTHEMENIKRRRSTFGRSRRSTLGGRRSLVPVDHTLSFSEQVQNIPKNLPATTRKSQLFDIVIRESLRRYEMQSNDEDQDIVDEIKPYILTNSENMAATIANLVTDQSVKNLEMNKEPAPCKPNSGQNEMADKVSAYRTKTKKLEEEYRQWKTLLKRRKRNLKASEQELKETLTGEAKIKEDQSKYLSVAYKEFLDKRPDYQKYLDQTQCLRQKTILVWQNVTRVGTIVGAFLDAARAMSENCYHIAEQMASMPQDIGALTNQVRQLFVSSKKEEEEDRV